MSLLAQVVTLAESVGHALVQRLDFLARALVLDDDHQLRRMPGERLTPSRRSTEAPACGRRRLAQQADDPPDDSDVGEKREARHPVERGCAGKVPKRQCARAVIERLEPFEIRRNPNLPQDRRGLISESAGDVSRRHERLELASWRTVRGHRHGIGTGFRHHQGAVGDRRVRPD
jgi:hypothetical protein